MKVFFLQDKITSWSNAKILLSGGGIPASLYQPTCKSALLCHAYQSGITKLVIAKITLQYTKILLVKIPFRCRSSCTQQGKINALRTPKGKGTDVQQKSAQVIASVAKSRLNFNLLHSRAVA